MNKTATLTFIEYTGELGTRPPFFPMNDKEMIDAPLSHPCDGMAFRYFVISAGKETPAPFLYICNRTADEDEAEKYKSLEGFYWSSEYAVFADGDYSEDEINSMASDAVVDEDGRLCVPLKKGDTWAAVPFWGDDFLLPELEEALKCKHEKTVAEIVEMVMRNPPQTVKEAAPENKKLSLCEWVIEEHLKANVAYFVEREGISLSEIAVALNNIWNRINGQTA